MRKRDEGAPADSATSEKVAREFRRGEPEAVEAVRARVRTILSFRGYGISSEDRRDLEQEVMGQLWRSVSDEDFRPEAGFWSFVGVVATRRCIDWLRTARQSAPLPESIVEKRPGPLGQILGRERSLLAHEALSHLGKPCRELIYLHAGLGLRYREIAHILKRREGTLRVQMFRCIQRAREVLIRLAERPSPALQEMER